MKPIKILGVMVTLIKCKLNVSCYTVCVCDFYLVLSAIPKHVSGVKMDGAIRVAYSASLGHKHNHSCSS